MIRNRPFATALLLGVAACLTSLHTARADFVYISRADSTISRMDASGLIPEETFVTLGGGVPVGIAFDGSGNLYVANNTNNIIQKVTPLGAISTFATTGRAPVGIAFDGSGNLFVANRDDNTIQKITPIGNSSIFANTNLSSPLGMAFDSGGNLFVVNGNSNSITKITPGGSTSVFFSGLVAPSGLAIDRFDNLYASNSGSSNSILKITPGGVSSTFASGLSNPSGLTFDPSGNLYATNINTNQVFKFAPDGSRTNFNFGGIRGVPIFLAYQVVPEPSSFALMGLGAAGLLGLAARRRKA